MYDTNVHYLVLTISNYIDVTEFKRGGIISNCSFKCRLLIKEAHIIFQKVDFNFTEAKN